MLILAATGLAVAFSLFVLWGYQENRVLQIGLNQVKLFQENSAKATDPDQKSRNNDLALRHLVQYLTWRPDDPEGLNLEAELLAPTADLDGATMAYEQLLQALARDPSYLGTFRGTASVYEHLLRIDPEPAGSRAQNARRRLAALYILLSDYIRMSSLARLMPEDMSKEYKYLTAEEHARHLLKEYAEAKAPVDDARTAEAHQLYALALEGQIVPGETERVVPVTVRGERAIEPWQVTVEDGAILEFENSLALQPGDIVTATHLAGLYQKASRKNTDVVTELANLLKALPSANRPKALDDLLRAHPEAKGRLANLDPELRNSPVLKEIYVDFLKVHPVARRLADLYQGSRKSVDIARDVLDRLCAANASVDVRRVRHAFFSSNGDPQAATRELEEAILLDPENLELILTAAEDARRSGAGGTHGPHFWLDQVPRSSRDDPRVLMVQGTIEYTAQNHEAALASWRKGLEQSNAADVGLCRQLALVLLELNRDDEAAKVVEQYRRLVPDADPVLRFLEGLQDEHAGRYSRAIERLGWARDRLPPGFQTPLAISLGRSQERQGDYTEAEKTYRAALRLDPRSVPLRQSLGRLLMATEPQEAIREFEQGLGSSPDQLGLLLSLAQARLQQQKALPLGRRNWADFDAVVNRVAKVAPSSTMLTLLKAEQLAVDARLDEAISFLQSEIGRLRDVVGKLRKDGDKLKEEVAKDSKNPELQIQRERLSADLELSANRWAGLAGRLTEYLLGQGRADQALGILEEASDPRGAGDRGSLRIQRALVLSSLGQGREARTVLLKDVDRLSPGERDDVWRSLFLLCKRQGDPETTRDVYNTWARLLPEDPKPQFALLEMDIEANDQSAIRARLESLRPRNERDNFTWRLVQAQQRLMEAKKVASDKDRQELLKQADTLVEGVHRDFKVDSVSLLLKGQILEAEGALDRAANAYSQASARGSIDALLRLVDLWTRLGRKADLERLRQNDKTNQLDPIEAITFLNHGNRGEASRIIEESLQQNPGRQSWQVGMLELLGQDQKAEAALRSSAEQSDKLEPWLALIRFQATPRPPRSNLKTDRRLKVAETLAELRPFLKDRWQPEVLEAEYAFAAGDWPAADRAFNVALGRYPKVPEVQAAAARYAEQKGHLDAADACLSRLKAEAYLTRFKTLLKDRLPELLKAQCHFAAADWPAADQAFDAARKRYPEVTEVQAEAARYQTQKGHEGTAEACLRRLEAEATIVAIKPRLKSKWPELLEAQCHWATANWSAADQAFDAARKRYPEVAEVQAVAASYQAQKGREDAAEACLRHLKVEATIVEIKQRVKFQWPELLEAQCRWSVNDLPAADQAFVAAVERYPDVRNVQATAARYYEQTGRLESAEACLRRILNRNPSERDTTRELAIVLASQTGRPDAWKQALELLGPEGQGTNKPEERLARAIVLGRSESPDFVKRAIDILQKLLADVPAGNPLVITARETLIRFLLFTGQPDQVDQASKLAGAVAVRSNNPAAIVLYTETLLQSRQFDVAEEQAKRLEQLDPRNPFLNNLRARLILGRSKPAGAATALEEAYLGHGNQTDAEQFGREIFPMILRLGPDAQGVAERLARRLAEHNPALSWMPASILANRGQREEALALCRTAADTAIQPLDLREACRIALDVAVAAAGQTTALQHASEITATARQHAPDYDDLRVIQAMIDHLQGRFDEEVRQYRAVLLNQPRNPIVLNNLAWALSEGLNQPSEGLEKIDELLAIAGRSAEHLDTRGVILTRLARFEQAARDLEESVKLGSNGVRLFHLARAYKKMGREEDFRRTFGEAQRAGLDLSRVDPAERAEIEALLKG
jgi:tetratricopeptide (TPR) repeat protein